MCAPSRLGPALAADACPAQLDNAAPPFSRPAAAVQNTVSFALNGVVFFFAGASACNFMIRCEASCAAAALGICTGSMGACQNTVCRCRCVHTGQPILPHPAAASQSPPTWPLLPCARAHPSPAPTCLLPCAPSRAVESLSDYWHSFALFPPVYLAMFLIRGISILLFNPLFHLLGSQALPLRAVLFATWGGLRWAVEAVHGVPWWAMLGSPLHAA